MSLDRLRYIREHRFLFPLARPFCRPSHTAQRLAWLRKAADQSDVGVRVEYSIACLCERECVCVPSRGARRFLPSDVHGPAAGQQRRGATTEDGRTRDDVETSTTTLLHSRILNHPFYHHNIASPVMASLPKPADSAQGAKLKVLLGSQWGDEGKGEQRSKDASCVCA